MRLSELKIKNFCCVGSTELSISIDNIVVLIGSNNSGKTTVLKAYEAFASTGSALSQDSFHKYNESSPVEITGTFSDITNEDTELLGKKWVYNHDKHGEVITCKWVWEKPGETGQKFSWNNNDSCWEKGGMGGWDSKITSCLPTPIKINPLDDSKTLESKIIDILTEAIKNTIKEDNSKINNLIDDFNKLAEEVKSSIEGSLTQTTDLLKEKLQDVFPDYGVTIKPEAGKIEPEKVIGLGSHIRVIDPLGEEYPLEKQGSGLQRAFLWSAIEALAEIGRYKINSRKLVKCNEPKVLLIEEPEVFLHPSAIRAAREALYKLSEIDNWQVMITTHSPIFIDVSKPHTTIIRVEKDSQNEAKTFSTEKAEFDGTDRERLRMIRCCNPFINEFFFADKIFLVEGETEEAVLNHIKESNILYSSIHVLNCFGKANIPLFEKILNHFEVSYVAMHDMDSPKCQRNNKWQKNPAWKMNEIIYNTANLNPKLKNIVISNIPDFEGQYFGYLQKGDKPYNAICEINSSEFQSSEQYKELINILDMDFKSFSRVITSVKDYENLLKLYICNKKPEPEEQWQLD